MLFCGKGFNFHSSLSLLQFYLCRLICLLNIPITVISLTHTIECPHLLQHLINKSDNRALLSEY